MLLLDIYYWKIVGVFSVCMSGNEKIDCATSLLTCCDTSSLFKIDVGVNVGVNESFIIRLHWSVVSVNKAQIDVPCEQYTTDELVSLDSVGGRRFEHGRSRSLDCVGPAVAKLHFGPWSSGIRP